MQNQTSIKLDQQIFKRLYDSDQEFCLFKCVGQDFKQPTPTKAELRCLQNCQSQRNHLSFDLLNTLVEFLKEESKKN